MENGEVARAAAEWRRFQGTEAYRRELEADRKRRAEIDIKMGHLPTCGILRCDPSCKRAARG